MDLWYPLAERKPLGALTEPLIGTPRVLIVHTMIGFLRGTDSMFRSGGYSGTESTFGVGGSWDGGLDGAIYQWGPLNRQADAQFDGNAYATSVETSDGGKTGVRWSDAQAEAIVKLGVWWCQQTGHPVRLVTSPSQAGFGYHAQFAAWNRSAHACPGTVRLGQYVHEVIPEIAARLGHPDPVPVKPEVPPEFVRDLKVTAPMMHGADVRAWQTRAAERGYGVTVDNWYGKQSAAACTAFQRAVGMPQTGVVDAETWLLTWVWEP
jgi:hypothetical protein